MDSLKPIAFVFLLIITLSYGLPNTGILIISNCVMMCKYYKSSYDKNKFRAFIA